MKRFLNQVRSALTRTRDGLRDTVDRVVKGRPLTPESEEALEEALLRADVSLDTAEKLLAALRKASPRQAADPENWAVEVLARELRAILERPTAPEHHPESGPRVIMIVGVNGTGKTTSVGKLARAYAAEGRRVLVVAADTFRAAANEQLRIWSERAGVDILESRPGSDPAAVAFDGLSSGRARGHDVVIVDTAGRLHSKKGLMDELGKVHRVMQKALPGAPHEVWLVLDGTTGQNAIQQARAFQESLTLTGLILTKIDGTAKGGAVVSITDTLGLPVRYLGVGEGIDDLIPFEAGAFAEALIAGD
jgi:fused signal recognition particle receptor